ncbi:MAG: transketolase-like TK C-terminal-containing protein, partial [Gemmatimonadales bacterium]
GLGEDGPTHQPVEQLAMLRAIPDLDVIRPADANETVEAWLAALARTDGPTAIVLTRQGLPVLDRDRLASAGGVRSGGYMLYEPRQAPTAIVIATGSEVHVALKAAETLSADGIPTRVVSLPCWELFERQPASWREEVLPESIRVRVSIEAAATFGWERYTGRHGTAIGLDHFGASAPGGRVMEEFGFTPDHAVQVVRDLMEGNS